MHLDQIRLQAVHYPGDAGGVTGPVGEPPARDGWMERHVREWCRDRASDYLATRRSEYIRTIMSELVPNLDELMKALPDTSDGLELAGAFDTSSVDEARGALRAIVAAWEQPVLAKASVPIEHDDLFGSSV